MAKKSKVTWLGLQQYAEHRGIVKKTIKDAIRDMRLEGAYKIMKDGRTFINKEAADILWLQNTDINNKNAHLIFTPTGLEKWKDERNEIAKKENQENLDSSDDDDDIDGLSAEDAAYLKESKENSRTLVRGRAAKIAIEAQIAQVKLKKLSGELIDSESVKKAAGDMARIIRDNLLNIPDKLAPRLAAENNLDKIHEMLTDELHSCLESLSNKSHAELISVNQEDIEDDS